MRRYRIRTNEHFNSRIDGCSEEPAEISVYHAFVTIFITAYIYVSAAVLAFDSEGLKCAVTRVSGMSNDKICNDKLRQIALVTLSAITYHLFGQFNTAR